MEQFSLSFLSCSDILMSLRVFIKISKTSIIEAVSRATTANTIRGADACANRVLRSRSMQEVKASLPSNGCILSICRREGKSGTGPVFT